MSTVRNVFDFKDYTLFSLMILSCACPFLSSFFYLLVSVQFWKDTLEATTDRFIYLSVSL